MSKKPQQNNTVLIAALVTLIVIMVAATGFLIYLCIDMADSDVQVSGKPGSNVVTLPTAAATEPTETEPPETTLPEPEHVVSTATVLSTGDLLMHKPIIDRCATSGGYDFSPMYQYIEEYVSAADYALVNLETTLAGTAKPYMGFPNFNCPDEIAQDSKDAGFDMFLTANNHAFDTGWDGYVRTLEISRGVGLDTLGTMATAEEPKYIIKELNGIKIGMLCYTYETTDGSGKQPALNGLPMYGATYDNINCYVPNAPERMYNEVEQYLAEMEAAGVDATMMFIHWGPNEYELYAKDSHVKMAQKFCDMGIDVIVGGHPHVVQPMDLLTSNTDPNHKSVVLYSMGNAVSNQRLGNLSQISTAHTEDGVLFSVTFEKYSDGTTYVQTADLIPTWVHLSNNYYILPLDIDREEEWKDLFGIDDTFFNKAKNSYARTMALVEEGLIKCQEWAAESKIAREERYLDMVMNPEKYATEPVATEAPVETALEVVETTAAAA